MVDNLFIVESPLQALVAVELSLQFVGQKNGVIFRLSGKGRERNDEQIRKVLEWGDWSFKDAVKFSDKGGLYWHLNARRYVLKIKNKFQNGVRNLFFGEFRAQWMHAIRSVINPLNTVLMDDGAATVIANEKYLSNSIYYPIDIFINRKSIKLNIKNLFFSDLLDFKILSKKLLTASAFLGSHADYPIDFSGVLRNKKCGSTTTGQVAYFFGSKYSEAGIISKEYELNFICRVKNYYNSRNLDFSYCAHRDESLEKLELIRSNFDITVLSPDLPAELFLIDSSESVGAISAAYSSVLNNLSFIFPKSLITSFMLDFEKINEVNRKDIEYIYNYIKEKGISVELNF